MTYRFLIACFLVLIAYGAWGQTKNFPNGSVTTNQGYASAAITASDTVKIPVTRAIYNGNASACNITMQLNGDSAAVAWDNVPSGAILPVQAVLVKSTGTTCSNLVAIY